MKEKIHMIFSIDEGSAFASIQHSVMIETFNKQGREDNYLSVIKPYIKSL